MILLRYTKTGEKRITDFRDLHVNGTCFLVGGSPSLKEQPIHMLEERGVLTMAMNNAATHFKPKMWVSGDHPQCYEPQILKDPGIMKFAPAHAAELKTKDDKMYRENPNMLFYIQKPEVPYNEFFEDVAEVPWYNNTLFVGIHILYNLGIRTIILAGSDFGFQKDGEVYAHKTKLGALERKWNNDVYSFQVKELKLMKPLFDSNGLKLVDTSKNSKLSDTYEHVSLEEGLQLAKRSFPTSMVDPATLPHCSAFATDDLKKQVGGALWPGPGVSSNTNNSMELVL